MAVLFLVLIKGDSQEHTLLGLTIKKKEKKQDHCVTHKQLWLYDNDSSALTRIKASEVERFVQCKNQLFTL